MIQIEMTEQQARAVIVGLGFGERSGTGHVNGKALCREVADEITRKLLAVRQKETKVVNSPTEIPEKIAGQRGPTSGY